MDNRRPYQQQQQQQQHLQWQQQAQAQVALDAAQSSHRSLVSYPTASTTPTTHVARHLGSMTINAAPPPFIHQQPVFFHPHQQPPPYTEYAEPYPPQVAHLASPLLPDDPGYWKDNANHAVRVLAQPVNHFSPSYSIHSTWPVVRQPSNYAAPPFAQHIFQHTSHPMTVYPTPPPQASSSSSSLAFALGRPAPQPELHRKPSSIPSHESIQSSTEVDHLLQTKSAEIRHIERTLTSHHEPSIVQPTRYQFPDSPDPLALTSSSSTRRSAFNQNLSTPSHSPLKRKAEVQLHSPSIKRVQIQPPSKSQTIASQQQRTPVTPRSARSKIIPVTPTSELSPGIRYKLAYVEVPPKPWLTPHSGSVKGKQKIKSDNSPDLGGYSSSEDTDLAVRTKASLHVASKLSGRRTGDRDDRVPIEKLVSFLDDIFEAEDALAPDMPLSSLPSEFFSQHTVSPTHPLLRSSQLQKITKLFTSAAHSRAGTSQISRATSKARGRVADIETSVLTRILKILERSVRMGEDLDPFQLSGINKVKDSSSNKDNKTPVGKKAKHDATASSLEHDMEIIEINHEELKNHLECGRDCILAAESCLSILTSDKLSKEVYSEELITALLTAIQNQLTKVIYPFVEASSTLQATNSAVLRAIVKDTSSSTATHRRVLAELFQAISSSIPRINHLVGAHSVSMSDTIIIQAVYISIGPFFIADQSGLSSADGVKSKKDKDDVMLRTFGKSAMRGLRLDALSLIRSIFAKHEEQRSWIIEEILNSLIKLSDSKQKAGQFRLRNGQSIRTVSALLMQLVQTSSHDVRIEAAKILKARQNVSQRQDSFTSSNGEIVANFLDEHDQEEIRLYTNALDSASKAAKSIIIFLTSRSGKSKTTKNSNEAEYRVIFDNLISDILVVLYWPEWPAASLILGIVVRFMVSSLDDIKTSSQNDNNAIKSIAIDQLGSIASRIRQSSLKVHKLQAEQSDSRSLSSLEEVVSHLAVKEFNSLLHMHQEIALHLCKQSSEDQAYDSARELTAATLGQELALSLKHVSERIANLDDETHSREGEARLFTMGKKIKSAIQDLWRDSLADVFHMDSPEEVQRIDNIAEEIGTIQSLGSSFPAILNVIVQALDAPAIFMRTKALRALGQVASIDPGALSSSNVRNAIESHLLDSSSAVRDAAVELIGKCMLDSKQVADDYWQKIAERIADTGVNVRKRVLKLLKSLYLDTQDIQRRIDISTRIVYRTLDEDDTVKDLALKTMQELWFEDAIPPVPSTPSRQRAPAPQRDRRGELQMKVLVIMNVTAHFKDHQSPLEDLLHHIIADKAAVDLEAMHRRYSEVCEMLIDGLVDASDLPGFTVVNCIKAIHLFTSAYPALLSSFHVSTLLPYLNVNTSGVSEEKKAEDQVIMDRLLKIFRASIPHISKGSQQFGQELQLTLQNMIIKPTSGTMILQEAVACMCIVVQHLTHESQRLVALMKSCNSRLQTYLKPHQNILTPKDSHGLQVLILIVSLLGEHFDFEVLRNDCTTDNARNLDSISERPMIEHVYIMLLKLYQKYPDPILKGRVLQCLGFLFRAQPTLMTEEASAVVMDAIFESSEAQDHMKLLKIMRDFLISEAMKHSEIQKGKHPRGTKAKVKGSKVSMDELVGNTEGFADSGVASAVVQRYVQPIHRAALSTNPALQSSAVDILSFTIRQGLSHPLESFPVVIALETSPNRALRGRANALHALMHGKHASILNTRILSCARTSFDYQKKICKGPVPGIRSEATPVAMLHSWYCLMREKRTSRQDLLRGLLKAFDVSTDLKSSQDAVDFTRYIAENLSAFDYKTQEEPMFVISQLTTTLSTVGLQIVGLLSTPEISTTATLIPEPCNTLELLNLSDLENLPQMRSSVVVGMAMILKTHLKNLYGLSEEKCSKYVPGKKNAIGDKPAIKRQGIVISWDRLPYAQDPLLSSHDMTEHKFHFLGVWNEDGVRPEPEDSDAMDL